MKIAQNSGGSWWQVVEAFQEPFLHRLMATLKKEMRKLSPSEAVGSISIAKLGGEEEGFGASGPGPGAGSGDDDGAAAARKSEKVRILAQIAACATSRKAKQLWCSLITASAQDARARGIALGRACRRWQKRGPTAGRPSTIHKGAGCYGCLLFLCYETHAEG